MSDPATIGPYAPGQALDHAVDSAGEVGNFGSFVFGSKNAETGKFETGAVGSWFQGMADAAEGFDKAGESPHPTIAKARAVQQTVAGIVGILGLPQEMLDRGIASLTNPIAALLPSLPAAFLGSAYLGMPHAHTHPPSLIPPAPPVPLPSIGVVTLGTCVRVLVGGMPAARCGDIGLAPTCGGISPFFEIKTGSSNVFIGGARAARMVDICSACFPSDNSSSKLSQGLAAAGVVAGAMAIGMDVAESAVEADAAMAAAKAMSAAMGAAQMAADAAAMAARQMLGKDPGIPPGSKGAIVLGNPVVLIGGLPLPPSMEIAGAALRALGKLAAAAKRGARKLAGLCPDGNCPVA